MATAAKLREETDARRRSVAPDSREADRRATEWVVTDTLCACGCGEFTRRGRGPTPNRYIRGHACRGRTFPVSTPERPRGNYKGGRRVNRDGYVIVLAPDHPRASHGYVMEHILVAERSLGKPLPLPAVIHHVDHNRANNGPPNLVVCQDASYHALLHARERAFRATGDPNQRPCGFCGSFDDLAAMIRYGRGYAHRMCRNEYQRSYRTRRAAS